MLIKLINKPNVGDTCTGVWEWEWEWEWGVLKEYYIFMRQVGSSNQIVTMSNIIMKPKNLNHNKSQNTLLIL